MKRQLRPFRPQFHDISYDNGTSSQTQEDVFPDFQFNKSDIDKSELEGDIVPELELKRIKRRPKQASIQINPMQVGTLVEDHKLKELRRMTINDSKN